MLSFKQVGHLFDKRCLLGAVVLLYDVKICKTALIQALSDVKICKSALIQAGWVSA